MTYFRSLVRTTKKPTKVFYKDAFDVEIEFKIESRVYWIRLILKSEYLVEVNDNYIRLNQEGFNFLKRKLMEHKFHKVAYTAKFYPERIIWKW